MSHTLPKSIPLKHRRFFLWVFIWILVYPACSLFQPKSQNTEETLNEKLLQMTSLAITQTKLANILSEPNPGQTKNIEYPTDESTSLATIQVLDETLQPESTPQPEIETVEMERYLKSAKILLFEDMSASRHLRFVKEALDRENYFYQDVGSAKGWFKSLLLSSVDWDLIIAAAEARRDFGGEFFEYLDQRIEQGASVIVEYWDWDAAPTGKAQLLLDRCGVSFQSDWYEPDLRVFFWTEPDSPVFSEPNQLNAGLHNAAALWTGDVGDLFRLENTGHRQDGTPVSLAATNPQYRNDHSILVSCINGRVILQGFSSHEYAKEDMIALWQNYIYHTLKNRFLQSPLYQPSYGLPGNAQLTQTPVPPAKIGELSACGESLVARVSEAPTRQRDLFEHHAKGEFIIFSLELKNNGPEPIQIYDQDYYLYGLLDGEMVTYQPDKAATGYLYIQNAGNLYQDLIQPGSRWLTNLAFDIDPNARDLVFVLKPGAEFQHLYCEVRISLELDYTE